MYLAAFDIVEADMFDANAGSEANQEVINKTKREALLKSIQNNGIAEEDVTAILDKYGYENISEITVSDYMKIVNELKKLKG